MYKRTAQGWVKHMDFILLDLLVLQGSFILGYMIRHGWGRWPYVKPDYVSLAIVLAVVDILVAVLFNTLHGVVRRGYLQEAVATLKQAGLVLVFMSLYMFSIQAGDTFSRITIYLTAAFHFILGYFVRILWKRMIRRINSGKNKATMILVADERSVQKILRRASEFDGFEYAGLVLSNRDAEGETLCGLRVVANLATAADYICREWVDEVFVYPEHLTDLKTSSYEAVESFIHETYGTQINGNIVRPPDQSGVAKLIEQCREMALPIHIRLPISSVGGKSFIEKVGGYNVLTMTANYVSPLEQVLKRVVDLLGGFFGSLAALLVIAVVGPKIKRESPGPILFKQTRIGKNGKKFTLYKIRSMHQDAEAAKQDLLPRNRNQDGMMFKMDFDPRIIGNRIVDGKQVTGIGEKIRSTSLDEFPQFFNVLRGDMSLVGTRPPTEDEWEKYQYHHRARLAVKPGLTGMWQVSGRSEITDFEEVVRLDTEYINNWSLGLDIRILLKTIRAVFRRDGAM